jgi:hypothetical protein
MTAELCWVIDIRQDPRSSTSWGQVEGRPAVRSVPESFRLSGSDANLYSEMIFEGLNRKAKIKQDGTGTYGGRNAVTVQYTALLP